LHLRLFGRLKFSWHRAGPVVRQDQTRSSAAQRLYRLCRRPRADPAGLRALASQNYSARMRPEDLPAHASAGDDRHAELRRHVEESRVRYRLDELVGMEIADARAVVEGAGGIFATSDEPLTAMLSPQRVVADIADGPVIAATIG
jgi:hypothetical protein